MLAEAKSRSSEIVAQGESSRPRRSTRRRREAKAEADAHPSPRQGRDRAGSRVARRRRCATRSRISPVAGAAKILQARSRRQARARRAPRVDPRSNCDRAAMAELTTIARPYAEAAFALARERERAAGVVADAAVRERGRRRSACRGGARQSEAHRPATRNRCCCPICGDKLDALAAQLRARAGRGRPRQRCCPQIATLFEALKDEAERRRDRRGSTARSRSTDAQLAASSRPRSRSVSARRSRRRSVVDPALIGGARITVGDTVIDASVQAQLQAMANQLRA